LLSAEGKKRRKGGGSSKQLARWAFVAFCEKEGSEKCV
jgi:hypothetical protein